MKIRLENAGIREFVCLQDEVLVAGVPLALMLLQLLLLKPAYAHWTAVDFHVHIG